MEAKTIDIFNGAAHGAAVTRRVGCRGTIVKDSRVLISHEVNTDYYLTPGGGLEEGETLEECCAREVLEETGYLVKPVRHFLTTNEHHEEGKYVNHYFLCEVIGEEEQSLTSYEADHGLIPEWIDIEKMLGIYARHEDYAETNIGKRSAYLREYTALTEYLAQLT